MRVRCVATVSDRLGNRISEGAIQVMVESDCSIERVVQEEFGHFVFLLTPDCDPMNVQAGPAEPYHYDSENSTIRNARDGLLTVTFIIDGEEGYVDENGNNQYDEGESFWDYDLAEPFNDANDNMDRRYEDEDYLDANNNGKWDEENWAWDSETKIWTKAYVLFTGPPYESDKHTRFEPASVNIPNAGSQEFTLHLVDFNHNPIAANGVDDAIELVVEGAQISGPVTIPLEQTIGFRKIEFGWFDEDSFDLGRVYTFTLADEDPDPGSPTEQVSVQSTVSWTPAPDYEEYCATPQSQELTELTGTAN